MRILAMFILAMSSTVFAQPRYTGELFDLRDWTPDNESLRPLEGQWEFYWNQLLSPEELNSKEFSESQRELVKVPSSWNMESGYPQHGFATYRSRILLPKTNEPLAINFSPISSSAKIFINGSLFGEIGKVHTELNEKYYKPALELKQYVIPPNTKSIELVIQVASYEFYLAGLGNAPVLGTIQSLKANRESGLLLSIFLIGSTLIMGIYHLCLFALRTRERSTLYFAILCISVAGYVFADYNLQPYRIVFPDTSYEAAILMFNSWVPGLAAVLLFTYEVFSKIYSRRFAYTCAGLVIAYYCYVFIDATPRRIVPSAVFPQIIALIYSAYTFYTLTKALKGRIEGTLLFSLGASLFIFSSIHDIVLALGLIRSFPLGPFGMIAFILSQSFLLASKFSNAFKKVEISEKEIRGLSEELKVERDQVIELNTNLEAIVDEKTRDIRSIMTHITLGIFAITKNNYAIHKDYSEHLKEIFEIDDLEGANAWKLLFENSSLTSDEAAQVQASFDMALGEDVMNYETNCHCLPSEIKRARSNGEQRIYELTWNAITNSMDEVEKILVSIRDVTELRALQEEAQDKQEELMFIGELLNVPAETFRRFIQTCQDFIAENRKLVNSKSIELRDMDTLKVLFINMHTMKGAARSLYLKKMTKIFHDVEQYYALLQKDPSAKWDANKMQADLDEVSQVLDVYESISRDKLGRHTGIERRIEINESDLVHIYELLTTASQKGRELSSTQQTLASDIRSKIFDDIFVSAKSVFEDVCSALPTLAKDLKKATPNLNLVDSGLYLNSKGEDLIRKIFVHFLRNSMDHGIESPDTRLEQGKTMQGTVSIILSKQQDHVHLSFFDDGGGLNISKIKEIASGWKLDKPIDSMSLEEAAELIFHSGLSTANQVSDVSGRGVGMDAIRSYLLREGGSVKIEIKSQTPNKLGRYDFGFEITLPADLFVWNIEQVNSAA